jgi:hypothetical protein
MVSQLSRLADGIGGARKSDDVLAKRGLDAKNQALTVLVPRSRRIHSRLTQSPESDQGSEINPRHPAVF